MAWRYPDFWPPRSLFASKEPFCTCVGSPLSQKRGSEDPIILYSNRVLPLFVLALLP